MVLQNYAYFSRPLINSENDSDKGIAATGRKGTTQVGGSEGGKENHAGGSEGSERELLAKDENSKFLQAILINLVRVSIRNSMSLGLVAAAYYPTHKYYL